MTLDMLRSFLHKAAKEAKWMWDVNVVVLSLTKEGHWDIHNLAVIDNTSDHNLAVI